MVGWIIGTVTLVAGGALVALNRLAVLTVKPPRTPPERSPDHVAADRVPQSFEVDGRTLRGWLFNGGGSSDRTLIILVHGWSAAADRLFGLVETLTDRGYPVFAFDVRDHGRSDPAPYTTLRHWRDDVAAGVRFAAERLPFRRRVLVGHSMGGAASTVVAADGAPLDGLALLASPADVMEVTAGYLSDQGLPGELLTTVLRPFWRRLAGMPFEPLTPLRRIDEVDVPLLLLQGDRDQRVPFDHLSRFQQATAATAVRVEDAGHSDLLDHPETHAALLDFLGWVETAPPSMDPGLRQERH